MKETSFRAETETSVHDASASLDSLHALTERVLKMLLKERLNIVVKQTFYDTGYPADSATRRPPVAEERETTIKREMQIAASDSIQKDETAVGRMTADVQVLNATKTVGETSQKTAPGMNMFQKILMTAGAISVISIIIYLILKFK
jgi:hypothetical protein